MKVFLCGHCDFSAWQFRRGLIKALIDRGIEVTLLTPDGPFVPKLKRLGANHVAVPFSRFSSPLRDLSVFFRLYRIFRAEKPDIAHNMSVKPNTYGVLAAWLAGVPRITSLVCGAGYAFSKGKGWKQAILKSIVSRLYWAAGKVVTRVWFLNNDDLMLFVDSGLLRRDKAVLILSEGVNLQEFSPDRIDPIAMSKMRDQLGIGESTKIVLMLARTTWSKGVKVFVEAGEHVARRDPHVLFVLAGSLAENGPDGVPETYLRSKRSPNFRWLGFREDVRELLALADVAVLPSYYREGVPRFLLEALAMGKPIVTTDNVGCREVVDDGENGFLVPARDSRATASAIEKLVRDAALRASFGHKSRAKAQNEFDENKVIERVLEHVFGLRQADVSVQRSPVSLGDTNPAMQAATGRSQRIAG